TRWLVPIVLRFRDAAGVKEQPVLLSDGEARVALGAEGPVAWCLGNAESRGFYRTAYDAETLARLLPAVAELRPAERVALVSDAWALVRAGEATIEDFLALVKSLGQETDHVVLDELVARLSIIEHRFLDDADRDRFGAFVAELFGAQAAALGWAPAPGALEDDETRLRRAARPQPARHRGDGGGPRRRRGAVRGPARAGAQRRRPGRQAPFPARAGAGGEARAGGPRRRAGARRRPADAGLLLLPRRLAGKSRHPRGGLPPHPRALDRNPRQGRLADDPAPPGGGAGGAARAAAPRRGARLSGGASDRRRQAGDGTNAGTDADGRRPPRPHHRPRQRLAARTRRAPGPGGR